MCTHVPEIWNCFGDNIRFVSVIPSDADTTLQRISFQYTRIDKIIINRPQHIPLAMWRAYLSIFAHSAIVLCASHEQHALPLTTKSATKIHFDIYLCLWYTTGFMWCNRIDKCNHPQTAAHPSQALSTVNLVDATWRSHWLPLTPTYKLITLGMPHSIHCTVQQV